MAHREKPNAIDKVFCLLNINKKVDFIILVYVRYDKFVILSLLYICNLQILFIFCWGAVVWPI